MPEGEASIRGTLGQLGVSAEVVVLWGTEEPYREFLYVDDLAEACLFLMKSYDASKVGEFINIGRGADLKLTDMAYLTRDVVEFEGLINFDSSKPDGAPRKLMDV